MNPYRMTRLAGLFALVSLITTAAAVRAEAPPGRIDFVGKNAIMTANSTFHRWKITKSQVDLSKIGDSFVEVEVDLSSVDTGIERRDEHLRTADFFDVEKWPTATVRVQRARPTGGDTSGASGYDADFEITMHGVTKTIPGHFVIESSSPLRVVGDLTIDRIDFGIGEPKSWNPLSIEDAVPVHFEATLAS